MRAFKLVSALVLPALTAVGLTACTVTPQTPKYPIYMEQRPATPATQPAPMDTAPAQAEEHTGVQPLGSKGAITTSELPPPPPPPPPANTVATKPTTPAATPAATLPVRDSKAGFVYTLQAKDTLFGVSRRFGVSVQTLYQMNGLTSASVTRIGQKILLPETAKDKGVETYAAGPAPERVKAVVAQADAPKPAVTQPVATQPAAPKPVVAAPTAAKPTVMTPSATPAPAPVKPVETVKALPADTAGIVKLGKGRFVWPYKGNVLVRYGQLAPNVRNDGINIGGPEGADVVAADEGTVVYVGDQVKELGSTVYIKHADGFYTGYSHLGKVNVKANQKIEQGQTIGTLGKTGAVDRPQLHFEIRYTPSSEIAKPFDPILVLP
ncbi:M23 family metallopeptidase [Asticcacaulis sp. AND118]|uniref:M23 family metallopeptidase n=1 Tax=Asticcacaulis sp. AND118 TaxID=2840468 RepID=UPI001CFF6234|nr:M23 family metallopeptidase [Asticcacaulis sp. AND118]UDF02589.1 M23 family metallopeptidase [Asticcacaulis sp. AND118]